MRLYIETERLILRNLEPADAAAAFVWGSDPEVNRFMSYPLYKAVEEVAGWIKSIDLDDPNSYDIGWCLKATGEPIGSGGLTYHPERDVWVVGYNIRKDQWGKGYTVEAIQAIMAEIQKTRELGIIEADIAAQNSKSLRVAEKLGMQYVCDTSYEKMDGSARFEAKRFRRDCRD